MKLVFLTLLLVNHVLSDLVTYVDYGGKVPTEDRFDVLFKYDADANRDCIVALKMPADNWKTYAYQTVSCSAGKGVAKALTLNYITNPPAGTGKIIKKKLINDKLKFCLMF